MSLRASYAVSSTDEGYGATALRNQTHRGKSPGTVCARMSFRAFDFGVSRDQVMPASGIAMGYYGGKGLPFFGQLPRRYFKTEWFLLRRSAFATSSVQVEGEATYTSVNQVVKSVFRFMFQVGFHVSSC
eukprot:913915-Rhodomonas_salina.1